MTSIIRRLLEPMSDGYPRRSSADSYTTGGGRARNVIASRGCQCQILEGAPFPLTTTSLLEDGELLRGSVSKALNPAATGNQDTFQQDEGQQIGGYRPDLTTYCRNPGCSSTRHDYPSAVVCSESQHPHRTYGVIWEVLSTSDHCSSADRRAWARQLWEDSGCVVGKYALGASLCRRCVLRPPLEGGFSYASPHHRRGNHLTKPNSPVFF